MMDAPGIFLRACQFSSGSCASRFKGLAVTRAPAKLAEKMKVSDGKRADMKTQSAIGVVGVLMLGLGTGTNAQTAAPRDAQADPRPSLMSTVGSLTEPPAGASPLMTASDTPDIQAKDSPASSSLLPALAAKARLGTRVRVTTAPAAGLTSPPTIGPAILGTLVGISKDTVTILRQSEKDRIQVPWSTIAKLELRKGHTRGRHALIGAGIAAAIGLVFALNEHSQCTGEFLCGIEFAVPVLIAPVGALVGVAVPGNQRWVDASPPSVAVVSSRRGVRLTWSVAF